MNDWRSVPLVVSDQAPWETLYHAMEAIAKEANRRLEDGDRALYEAIHEHCPAVLEYTEAFDPDPWGESTA